MTAERVICPRCRRKVAGRVPRGGDGSALRTYPHRKSVAGAACPGGETTEIVERDA